MINIPASLPMEKRLPLESLVGSLSKVPHMQAVVLGGSCASGTRTDLEKAVARLEAAWQSVAALADAGCQPKY
jgi:hypothetical protein